MSRNCSSLTSPVHEQRQENPAGLDRAERELVHVEVFLQRRDHLLAVARHLGRVEHDDVEFLRGIPRNIAQPREDVGLDESHLRLVQARVLLGQRRGFPRPDRCRRLPPRRRAPWRRSPKPPELQHRSSTRLPAQNCVSEQAVVALVGEEAGLVLGAGCRVKIHAMFVDHRRLGRRRDGARSKLSCFCTCSSANA